MNKKILLTTLIGASIFIMAGCSNSQSNDQSKKPSKQSKVSTAKAPTASTSKDSKQPENTNSSSENTTKSTNKTTNSNTANNKTTSSTPAPTNKPSSMYSIAQNTYTIANIKINYPQISNLGDNNKQLAINNLIKDSVINGFNLTQAIKTKTLPDYNEPIENLTLNVNYTVELQNSNILSIRYLGSSNMKGSAHPNNELYTTNIDINNAKTMNLQGMFSINQTLITSFRKGAYIPYNSSIDSQTISKEISTYNDSYLQTAFEKSDNPIGQENPSSAFSYLTKDGLVISIGITHAAGDHAELKIPYSSIKSIVKTDNKALNGLF
ncbi:hypothetical protein NL50_14985 [Clostridium acetobutylicum]|nr:hypothetical protein NL50_14985 [Clostridium acetobutylicum]